MRLVLEVSLDSHICLDLRLAGLDLFPTPISITGILELRAIVCFCFLLPSSHEASLHNEGRVGAAANLRPRDDASDVINKAAKSLDADMSDGVLILSTKLRLWFLDTWDLAESYKRISACGLFSGRSLGTRTSTIASVRRTRQGKHSIRLATLVDTSQAFENPPQESLISAFAGLGLAISQKKLGGPG